jgi:DNA recombination protein RmuC
VEIVEDDYVDEEPPYEAEEHAPEQSDEEFASVSIISGAKSANTAYDAPSHAAQGQSAYQQPDYRDTDYREARARAEAEAAEIRARAEADAAEARRRAEDDAAHMRRRAEEEADRQAEARRIEERKRFQEEEAAHERARLAAAEAQLAEREKKLASEASNIEAEISRRLEERFAALAANYDANGVSDGETQDDDRPATEMRLSARGGDDDVYQTLEAVEDALVAQSEALKAETRNQLDQFSARFEKRMASLSSLLEQSRVASAVSAEFGEGAGDSHAIADLIAQRLAEHRDSVNDTLVSLSNRIDDITKGPEDVSGMRKEMAALRTSLGERNLGPSAPLVQLADIIGNALPPNAYALGAILSNGRKADCLVKLPHPPGPVAIDARFPVEAFNRLHEARNDREAADNEFRRTALRHIVDIAERLISPEETAESALMFIPSESMYAEFHARFPDVVQDSYRARVWIVSPTTLMATLHTIRAILRDARSRENAGIIQAEAQHVLTEVEQLRQRVASLESSFDRARDDVRSLASSTDKVYRRAETITNTGRALAEESLDRGSRRIISAPADDDSDQPAPQQQPRAAATTGRSATMPSQTQHRSERSERTERSSGPATNEAAPEGAPTIYRDNPYRRGAEKSGSQPNRDTDGSRTPFPLR